MSNQVNKAGKFIAKVLTPQNNWLSETEKGTPYVFLPFTVTEGSEQGKTIGFYGYMSEAAFDRTMDTLTKAFPHWDGDLNKLASDPNLFVDKECLLVVESEVYEGKTKFKVKWLNPCNEVAKPMHSSRMSELISKMSARSKAIAKSNGFEEVQDKLDY